MFGEGRSFQEAWDDLFIHFRIDKDALEANEDRLATDLRPELARLRILFPEKS